MLNCRETTQLVSKSLDRHLTWRERFAVNLHLIICKYCKRFSQQLIAMRSAFNRISKLIENDHNIQLPSATKTRITNAIESIKD
ncbi:zf-HC2 domain-containing protein [Methylotenera versatilis]|uniref:zf-HC2 domain-containing protein n=1 Tax=Methylotenera versatilis TaxID=1055487 RepID=UPI0009DF0AB3|nr:zf-HC2 domain-containing protein [Methylotenera versatilis]